MSNPDDYADEWEQLDNTVILVQILTELQQIRMALTDTAQTDDTPMYECTKCNATMAKDERERHAIGQHKAHAEMVASLFEVVE